MKYFATAVISFVLTGIMPIFFFITIPVCIIYTVKCVMLGINNDKKGAGRNTMTKLDIWEHIPDFSVESFVSSVDNKVRALHFAKEEKDVKAICLCPLNGVLSKYENVAVCTSGRYLLKEFQQDMEHGLYHIGVEMDLDLMELDKNKLKPRKEYVKMTLSRDMTSVDGTENDAQMFRCCNCGATVSLVEGGICKYCNTPIEMIHHDWVITRYESEL